MLVLLTSSACQRTSKNEQKPFYRHQVLILDGHNNHYIWPKSSAMMKDYLEETKLFDVEIHRLDTVWLGIKYNKSRSMTLGGYLNEFPVDSLARTISEDHLTSTAFAIDFGRYDVIVSNLGAETPDWPDETKKAFEQYMEAGGGLVVVHAANNAWSSWTEYNKMIGLGAWGGRDSTSGSFVFYDDQRQLQFDESDGIGGSHGAEHEYLLTTREPDHPIMKGLPAEWLHAKDELYDRMRGPFENATILATAFSDEEKNKQSWQPMLDGSGKHVPMLMTIDYGKGRIFHSTLGHFDYSMECVGFITTFTRGVEWAATGAVTQAAPEDFPKMNESISRKWDK